MDAYRGYEFVRNTRDIEPKAGRERSPIREPQKAAAIAEYVVVELVKPSAGGRSWIRYRPCLRSRFFIGSERA
jgi:hypothetical protein